jgi:hypothetical protein
LLADTARWCCWRSKKPPASDAGRPRQILARHANRDNDAWAREIADCRLQIGDLEIERLIAAGDDKDSATGAKLGEMVATTANA